MLSKTPLNDCTTVKQQISFAMRLCQLKEYSQARSYLLALLSQQRQNAHAWYLLSFIASQQQLYGEAIKSIKEAIKIEPGDAALHHNLGNIYLNQKQVTKAIRCYRHAISLQPEAPNLYRSLGMAYTIQEDMVAANFSYGVAEHKQGNRDEAVRFYRKTLELEPEHALAHYKLAEIRAELGDPERAISHYQEVVKLRPHNVSILYRMAEVRQEQGRVDEAIYYYKKVVQKKPKHGESYLQLSFLYRQQGKLSLAFAACQKALKYHAQDVDSFYEFDSDLFEVDRSLEAIESGQTTHLIAAFKELEEKSTKPEADSMPSKLPAEEQIEVTSEQEADLTALQMKLKEKYSKKKISNSILPSQSLLGIEIPRNSSLVKVSNPETAVIPVIINRDLELEIPEETEVGYAQYDSIYHQHSVFQPIEKSTVAERFVNNDRSFILTTFITPHQEYLLPKLLEHLEQTQLSYCIYRTSIAHHNFTAIAESQGIRYSKPNYLASVYEDLNSEKPAYQRKYRFSHLLYVEPQWIDKIHCQEIELLQNYCELGVDFAISNWLQNIPQSTKDSFGINESFLIALGAMQLYSLSDRSLWIWEVWQQAIVECTIKLQQKPTQILPGDESFLDYAWNSILCHIPKIKHAWLVPDREVCASVPLARTLVH